MTKRNTEDFDMKAFLIEQMVGITSGGKLVPQQAEAVAALAQQVYNFTKLEIEASARGKEEN